MATSWTQADIDALESSIKKGVRTVQFENRSVTYHSLDEMLKLLDTMRSAVAQTSGGTSRSTYAQFSKG